MKAHAKQQTDRGSGRKRLENSLAESEQRFREMADNIPALIFQAYVRPDGSLRFSYVSPREKDLFGFPMKLGASGWTLGINTPAEDREHFVSSITRAVSARSAWDYEGRLISPSKEIFWYHAVALPVLRGDELFYNGVLYNITRRKNAEAALENALAFNRAIVSDAGEGVIVYDRKFRLLEWNPYMEKLTGMKKKDVLGKVAFDIFPHLREQGIDKLLVRALNGDTVYSEDTPYHVSSTRRAGWVRGIYTPRHDKDGNIIGVIGLVHDVTERRKAEELAEQRKRELEQKNAALSAMVEQIVVEKNKIREQVTANVEEVLMPIIKKLRLKGFSGDYARVLEYNLRALSSSFGAKLARMSARLTPREVEICAMIKSGLPSKSISELLNCSILTVSKHRRNIRHKLGLTEKKANLTLYLQKL